jgi:hypothetical protein
VLVLLGCQFSNDDDLESGVCKLVHTILIDWFAVSIIKLPERCRSYTDLGGEYVECANV